jgi:hypothetical protein
MLKISPEHSDSLEMEMHYKRIGDDYALYLIRTIDELENKNNDVENQLCEKENQISNVIVEINFLKDFVFNEMSELKDEKDFKTLTDSLEKMSKTLEL